MNLPILVLIINNQNMDWNVQGQYAVPLGRNKLHVSKKVVLAGCVPTTMGVIALVILYLKYPPFRQAIHKLIAGPLSTLAGL
jgi:hypothetical protein